MIKKELEAETLFGFSWNLLLYPNEQNYCAHDKIMDGIQLTKITNDVHLRSIWLTQKRSEKANRVFW